VVSFTPRPHFHRENSNRLSLNIKLCESKSRYGFSKEKNDSSDPIFMKSSARVRQVLGPKLNSPGKF
jgi:hypothetical protein